MVPIESLLKKVSDPVLGNNLKTKCDSMDASCIQNVSDPVLGNNLKTIMGDVIILIEE